jgi:sulfoxide reductase catalytic subunit YedY
MKPSSAPSVHQEEMTVKRPPDVKAREITDPKLALGRRAFLRAGLLAGSVAGTAALYRGLLAPPRKQRPSTPLAPELVAGKTPAPGGEKSNSYEEITGYNNFYEFSTDKYEVAEVAAGFASRPWMLTVGGLCHKPRTFDLDDLFRRFPLEERVYRMRCVEGWSMVIPWNGFPLGQLLSLVEPFADARYVSFTTLLDPARLPNQRRDVLPWPYVEGLRLDEAMHPLTILAGGLYGETLPPQNGAPVRLVVPWKYGFKGAKSIVKIELIDHQPKTTWARFAPDEYGFYSNVNPDVPHPRWSQATERRIGELGKRETLLFNGYGAEVAHLYAGMDLRKNF